MGWIAKLFRHAKSAQPSESQVRLRHLEAEVQETVTSARWQLEEHRKERLARSLDDTARGLRQ